MQILSSPENTLRCILVSAAGCFGVFNQNPKLSRMLSHNTFELDDLLKPKTALFIVTDDTTSTADPIVGIIISQIQSFLIDNAYHSKDGHLETRINFVLDEFASIPIPNMDKALATHRSSNIRYYLCVQSLALLNEIKLQIISLLKRKKTTYAFYDAFQYYPSSLYQWYLLL